MRKTLIALIAVVSLATAGISLAAADKDSCGTCGGCAERSAGGDRHGLTPEELAP